MTFDVRQGDCVELMRAMPACSVDAVVCDPPYGLEFMGKDWDRLGATLEIAAEGADVSHPFRDGSQRVRYGGTAKSMQEWHQAWATEALRVLKPGGHLLAFGGTRTYHRLVCAVEDAGFEIRDTIAYMYGSGFPKSLNVGKAIDRAAGAEREVTGASPNGRESRSAIYGDGEGFGVGDLTAPATPEAERWEGWGTALKPAHEPVVVARKPLSGTVAATVLEHGTGALNIDGTRIEGDVPSVPQPEFGSPTGQVYGFQAGEGRNGEMSQAAGRWPPNVALSHMDECEHSESSVLPRSVSGSLWRYRWSCHPDCPVRLLDEQTGELHARGNTSPETRRPSAGTWPTWNEGTNPPNPSDAGGASRFFPVFKKEGFPYERSSETMDRDSAQGQAGSLQDVRDGVQVSAEDLAAGTVDREAPSVTRFRYVAKASRAERSKGVVGDANTHPT